MSVENKVIYPVRPQRVKKQSDTEKDEERTIRSWNEDHPDESKLMKGNLDGIEDE